MKVFVVLAAYNEDRKIEKVISDLRKQGYHNIVVVDDGSSDRTFEISRSQGVYILKHVINRGQGAALKTGIDYSIMKGADIVVTFDADGQFLASEIKKMLIPILNEDCDVVLGSRFLGRAVNIPLLKKWVLKMGVYVVRVLYGIRVTDSQCGFRAITSKAAKKMKLTSDRMEHAGEIFHEIVRNKLKYKEVPVTVLYDDYALRKGQDWTRSIELGFKMILNRLK